MRGYLFVGFVMWATVVSAAQLLGTGSLGNDASGLVGTWQLVTFDSRDSTGAAAHPLGRQPQGLLMYDENGWVSVQLLDPHRPRFESADRVRGTDAEVRAAFSGSFSYYGRYTVDPRGGNVTHRVEGASFPNWMGTDLVRSFRLDRDGPGVDRLTLTTPLTSVSGQQVATTLVWKRAG